MNMRISKQILWCLVLAAIITGCYSNNCPLENTVLCNYHFYDSEGTPISYGDAITVTTLRPGWKNVYIYRKLGNTTVTLDIIDSLLIKDGYTMTQSVQRNDTVLLNKKSNATSISLPMSYFSNSDTLVFAYGGISLKDTIILQHDSYPHVELPECGTYRFHTLRGVRATDSAIDHIEIGNAKVNYDGAENVKIYFNGVVSEE